MASASLSPSGLRNIGMVTIGMAPEPSGNEPTVPTYSRHDCDMYAVISSCAGHEWWTQQSNAPDAGSAAMPGSNDITARLQARVGQNPLGLTIQVPLTDAARATVEHEDLSADEARLIAGEKRGRMGYVPRRPLGLGRGHRAPLRAHRRRLLQVVIVGDGHGCPDHGRHDRVGPDATVTFTDSDVVSQGVDAALRGGVDGVVVGGG